MPALLFDTCFGCIALRTGCLIIGYLQLVLEIIAVTVILMLVLIQRILVNSASTIHFKSSITQYDYDYIRVGTAVQDVILIAIFVILLLTLVLALPFTVVLLVGVHKYKREYVMAYMVYATIVVALDIITFFVSLWVDKTAANITTNLLIHALNIYFLLVVRSYYYQMDQNRPVLLSNA